MDQDGRVSLWDMSAAEAECGGSLDDRRFCDLAIVGAGFTGLSTALHGAGKGLDCHVLEAERIGFGGSGRNFGLVNAGLWLPPQDVEATLGRDRGNALVRRLGEMPGYVFSLIETHQIQCEATRSGTIHAAHSPAGFEDLRRRAEGWQAHGAPVDLLGPAEVAERTGTRAFSGSLLDHRAGTINPMGYARGLARAARAAGAKVSTGVRVTGLKRDGGVWRVETDGGTIRAAGVVIATNAYTDDLWPGLRRDFSIIQFLQVATEPLGERVAHILPDRQGLWDTAPVMFALRKDAFGRLIVGSMGSDMGPISRRFAAKALKRLYPDLGPVRFEKAWNGQIAMTPDHLFRIHRLAEGIYAPIGYNGRGITTGTMFGQALADLFTGADEQSLPVPVTDMAPVPARRLKAGFYRAAFAANQIVKSI